MGGVDQAHISILNLVPPVNSQHLSQGLGWGYFINFSVARFSTQKLIGPNRIQCCVKMRGQKALESMKKGVNWIENQGENLYKMLKMLFL